MIVSACGQQLTRSGRHSINGLVLQSRRGSDSQSSQPLALVRGALSRRRPVKLLCKYHPQTFCYFGSLHVFGNSALHLPTRRRPRLPSPSHLCMRIPDQSGCWLVSSTSFILTVPDETWSLCARRFLFSIPFVYWHTPRICLVPSESTPTGLQKPKNYKVSIWWCVSALSLFSPTASRVSSHPLKPPSIYTHTIRTRQNSTPPDVLDFPTLPHALVQPFHLLLLFSACAAFQLQAEKRRQQDACCGRPCLRRLRCHKHWDRRLRCGSKPCRMRSPVPALMTGGLRPPSPFWCCCPN